MRHAFSTSNSLSSHLTNIGKLSARLFAILNLLTLTAVLSVTAPAQTSNLSILDSTESPFSPTANKVNKLDSLNDTNLTANAAAPLATVIVSPNNLNGFAFFQEVANASGTFVFGPGTPPLGQGSAQLTVDNTGREILFTRQFAGTRLDAITELKYSAYRNNTANPNVTITLQFDVDYDLADTNTAFMGRLVFEPAANGITVAEGVFQTFDTLDAVTGKFFATGAPGNGTCTQASPCTKAQLLAAFPNVGIRATGSNFLLLKLGGPIPGGLTANADALSITVNGVNTTFDFEPAASTLVVDDDGMASATDCNAAATASMTIQGAVNAANPGDTIRVCPGTYTENVNVNKQLMILGPNAAIDPNTGTRVEEAIVRTAISNPVDATNCAFITDSAIVTLSVAGITFNGFTLDGDNPNLTSTFNFNGANIDAYSGVYSTPAVAENANQTVTNNIVRNIGEFGIFLNGTGGGGPRTGGSAISNNKVDNVIGACFGQGIRIDDGAFANITNNVITRVFSGVTVENFFTNTTPAPVVDNNKITAFGYAIYHNLHYAYSTNGFTYSNNTINSYVQENSNFDRFRGIMLESIIGQVPVTLTSNTIMPDRAALVAGGYTRVDGIYITNTSTNSPNILITLNKISNALRGISHVAPAVPTVTCNNITGNNVGVYVGTDMQFGGTPSSSTNGININRNNIVGNPTFGVQNESSFVTNAENNYWGAANGPGPVGPGSGDRVTLNVDFDPFLTAPSSCAPTLVTTAATTTISGRVLSSNGLGLARVSVILTELATGQTRITRTNKQGLYNFDEVEVGENYVVSLSLKGYSFSPSSKQFSLFGELSDVDFTASREKGKESVK